jgi:alpha-galactosidase
MSDEVRDILTNKEVIAIDQDPLGKQGYQFMTQPGKEIWVKELSDGNWTVCFFNSGDNPLKIRLKWEQLWFLKGTYKVRDLWQKKDIGTTKKGFTCDIAPHDVLLLKLSLVK